MDSIRDGVIFNYVLSFWDNVRSGIMVKVVTIILLYFLCGFITLALTFFADHMFKLDFLTEGVHRGELFKNHGVELLVLDRRVEFTGGSVWFNTSWFCSGILPERLMFAELYKRKSKV
jgi:hypothetical protein